MANRKVLIVYYSYSAQTRKLANAYAVGLRESGVEVVLQPLRPMAKIPFPVGSMAGALSMMVWTFFRRRIPIHKPGDTVRDNWQAVVLAGPTWSYNPSGPVLSFLDDHGDIFRGRLVVPLISCRGYWRLHYWQLRAMLRARGADVLSPLIFKHPGKEPWRTIGVFLKVAGRNPEKDGSWIGRYYTGFGHCREQVEGARDMGRSFGERLSADGEERG